MDSYFHLLSPNILHTQKHMHANMQIHSYTLNVYSHDDTKKEEEEKRKKKRKEKTINNNQKLGHVF